MAGAGLLVIIDFVAAALVLGLGDGPSPPDARCCDPAHASAGRSPAGRIGH